MLQSLKHKMNLTSITIRLISGESHILRRLSTATSPLPPKTKNLSRRNIVKQNLYKRLSAIGATGEEVWDVLHELKQNGERITRSDLAICVKELRKFGRYHHCLEILDWMDKVGSSYSAADCTLRLDIVCKAKGIDEAEKFFDNIPQDAKNHYVYGALLNCYCTQMMTDKALALFEKMDELKYASNVLAFNNLMCLYLKIGKPEKVSSLVEEMKRRNIPLNNHTYYIWIQSCRHLVDLKGVERVIQEAQEQDFIKDDWQIYSNLAAVYIDVGQCEKAKTTLIKAEELLDGPKKVDRVAYHYLISLYTGIGDLESVHQVWHKMKSRFKVRQNSSYLVMLQSLSKLDDISGLKSCLQDWESSHKTFDDRLPTVVIGAYLRHDMLEEAQQLLKDIEAKSEQKIKIAHVHFLNYFLKKHQFDSALKHLEAAMSAKWKPLVEKLEPFFEHFKEEKDVDSAEGFCRILEKVQPLDSKTYLWLLQTYAAAGKTSPRMRQRMEENGVDISAEHEELLRTIC